MGGGEKEERAGRMAILATSAFIVMRRHPNRRKCYCIGHWSLYFGNPLLSLLHPSLWLILRTACLHSLLGCYVTIRVYLALAIVFARKFFWKENCSKGRNSQGSLRPHSCRSSLYQSFHVEVTFRIAVISH
jgi:hypothetical protein